MLDPKLLRNNPQQVKDALRKRKGDLELVDKFIKIDEKWRELTFKADDLKAQRNELSDQIGQLKKKGQDAKELVAQTKVMGDRIKELDDDRKIVEEELQGVILEMPNVPHHSVPEGVDERDNLELRKWGKVKKFDFKPRPHNELGEGLKIMDFERAAKMSGSRFVVMQGRGAALERALINFMLDTQVKENGYTEVFPPILVHAKSMTGTGQLPKFEADLFKCRDDELFLVPTAEVSVTNLHREEILKKEELPFNYCAYSPCFRREAGSYGKDVQGIMRQHQFNKIELVKFCDPESSYEELEKLTRDAESILQKLELPYRVVALCSADLGFAAAKTYDLEVWFPSQGRYREISSCSNFEEFQARRADIRFRKDKKSKPQYVHTLNGSGLAVGRALAALLENFQQEDGTVLIPKALQPYLGFDQLK